LHSQTFRKIVYRWSAKHFTETIRIGFDSGVTGNDRMKESCLVRIVHEAFTVHNPVVDTRIISKIVIICLIAIAYSMGQIIKSFCVCACVCLSVCGHSHGRTSSSIFTKLDTDV